MASKLLSVFAALRGPLGGGDLRVGGGPLAPPDGGCCAMHRDGSYWANITTVGALGDSGKPTPYPGVIAFDVPRSCATMAVGSTDPQHAPLGVLFYPCESAGGGVCGTAWDEAACHDFTLPGGTAGPSMCVGAGAGVFSTFAASGRVDVLTTADTFASADGNHFLAVSRYTCMPLHAWSNINYGVLGLPQLGRVAAGSASRGSGDDSWAVSLVNNATAHAPPGGLFTLPARCAARACAAAVAACTAE